MLIDCLVSPDEMEEKSSTVGLWDFRFRLVFAHFSILLIFYDEDSL